MPRSPIPAPALGRARRPALVSSLLLLSVGCGADNDGTTPPVSKRPLEISADANTVILDHFNEATVGTPAGGVTYSPSIGSLAKAADLGTGAYVKYALTAPLESQATIEFWLKPRLNGSALLNFNWGNTTSYPSAGHVLHLRLDENGRVEIGGWAADGCMYNLTSSGSVTLNQWHHIALSWGAQTKIYVDGAVSASSPQCFRPTTPAWAYLNYWGNYDSGSFDELHISKVQRSDAEIAAHAAK
jgi:hypothetical protein